MDQTLFLGAPKSLQMVIAAMKFKDAYSFDKNEIMTFAALWMDLEIVILSKAEKAEIKLPTSAGSWKKQQHGPGSRIRAQARQTGLAPWLCISSCELGQASRPLCG